MEDKDLWEQYAGGVQKLGEKPDKSKPQPDPKPETITATPYVNPRTPSVSLDTMPDEWRRKIEGAPPVVTPVLPPLPAEEPKPVPPPVPVRQKEPLDLRIERNLSLGDVMIEAKLDLHGKTESEAHEKLLAFIETQYKRGRRLVLVITGKGKDGTSVLRSNLPRWCDVPPLDECVLAVRTAAPHHGGDGAYYVLLRKKTG